jgi:hypothetical protein
VGKLILLFSLPLREGVRGRGTYFDRLTSFDKLRMSGDYFEIKNWDLDIVWNLMLGIWDLIQED